jgi:hypothetical protein
MEGLLVGKQTLKMEIMEVLEVEDLEVLLLQTPVEQVTHLEMMEELPLWQQLT